MCRSPLILLVLLTLMFGTALEARQANDRDSSRCFAYQWDGAIYLMCGNQRHTVATHLNALAFAVSDDGETLAVIRRSGRRDFLDVFSLTQVGVSASVPLKGGTRSNLYSRCGQITYWSDDPDLGFPGEARYVRLNPKGVSFEAIRNHDECSWTMADIHKLPENRIDLQILTKPVNEIREDQDRGNFDTSPNGRWIAYHLRPQWLNQEICVVNSSKVPACLTVRQTDRIPLSAWGYLYVADDGEVIFENHTTQACFYKDKWHASPRPRTAYTERDACFGVAAWKPGNKELTILEPLGNDPVWITPKAASALRSWSKRFQRSQVK